MVPLVQGMVWSAEALPRNLLRRPSTLMPGSIPMPGNTLTTCLAMHFMCFPAPAGAAHQQRELQGPHHASPQAATVLPPCCALRGAHADKPRAAGVCVAAYVACAFFLLVGSQDMGA